MEVIIDTKSGFCFGVKNVIARAEKELKVSGFLYCLGDIVHNDEEIARIEKMGLKVIDSNEYLTLSNCKVLIRAHGEPPNTYNYAHSHNIELIEGTCPIVLKLQEKVRKGHKSLNDRGSLIIFGKPNHPEVLGLNGQIDNKGIVIDNKDALDEVDFTKPIALFAQTTMNREEYIELKTEMEKRMASPELLDSHDTICGQIANRSPWLKEFSTTVDAVVFAGGKKSSNSKVLFQHCKKTNPNSFFISSVEEVDKLPLKGFKKVGVCGATSTPLWLMEDIARKIETLYP